MRLYRVFIPLLLALTLLFAQQAGVMHALSHTLAEQGQQNKQLPHSPAACGQCAAYTQLGSALSGMVCFPLLVAITVAAARGDTVIFHSTQPIAVVARGPPAFLQAFI